MFNWNRAPRPPAAEAAPGHAPQTAAIHHDAAGDMDAIRAMAGQASALGKGAAELDGVLQDAVQFGQRQVDAFGRIAQDIETMAEANRGIAAAVAGSRAAVADTRAAVAQVGEGVLSVVTSLREVAGAATEITRIALQTRLVAFNASVEAKRAGEAGAGFGVVADAVKALAAQVEASSKQIMGTVTELDGRIDRLAASISEQCTAGAAPSAFHAALARVEASVDGIGTAVQANLVRCGEASASVTGQAADVQANARLLERVGGNTRQFLQASEMMIELAAGSGAETPDTPYIEAVLAAARELSQRLDAAVQDGRISLADLFDERYQPVHGSNPLQHQARFTALTDALFPEVQERLLGLRPQVVFCAAVDRNGYLPTHNRKFSHPQGADPVWNAAHSRHRRIFNDRTGLAAGRNTRRFLLQTYRRDMGGGQFVLMKDLSAPIQVQGRHWGGLRLAYQF